jgi:hypothetical protein
MTETVSRSASAGMNRPGRASARGQGPAGGWIDLVSSTTSRRSLWPAPSTHSRLRNRRWQDRVLGSADMRTRSRSSFQAAAIIPAVRSLLRPRAQRPGGGLCTTVLSSL